MIHCYNIAMDEKLIEQIKKEIKKQDLTITKLALRANTSRAAIGRVLTPTYDPTFKLVNRIVGALGKKLLIELE